MAAAISRKDRRAAASVPARVIVTEFMEGIAATPHEMGEVATDVLMRFRGAPVLTTLVDADLPPEILRDAITTVWLPSSHLVARSTRKPRDIARLFRAAQFPLPDDMPGPVTV